ncbi:hypothetical protein MAALD49_12330 [Marinobacter shengliensis]|nr:hypothetical protein MAALD49_12330 [Marinobacter shengliensis]
MTDSNRHLPFIHELCEAPAANGYRTNTARLNRLLAANDERVNHKRMYRLMKQDGLLLPRHTGRPQERCHNGQIIILKPDLRWYSDGLEIRFW